VTGTGGEAQSDEQQETAPPREAEPTLSRHGAGHRQGSGRGAGSGQTATSRTATGKATTTEETPQQSVPATETPAVGATVVSSASTPAAASLAPSEPVAATASVASAVASAPAGAGVVSAQPKSARRAGRHRASASRSRAHGAGSGVSAAATVAAGTSPLASSVRGRPTAVALARKAEPRKLAAKQVSPLARTITRIVGVVPTPIRALIGALLALALGLAVRSSFAALRARRLDAQRRELLEDVGLLQAALLPLTPERLGPVGTSVAYRPAAGPGAGGDFYDVFALEDGQLAVIVGDISGHGRKALPHTALVRFTLRAYLEAGLSPRGAVQTAGAVLEHQLGESFATVLVATYQPRERVLTYASAGHPPPLVLGSEALVARTVCSAPPIGIGRRTGTRQSVVSLPGSAQLCFYTDGVTEARVAGDLFGADRLTEALSALGPQASASALLDRVAEEVDSRPDDMAACLLSVEGDGAAPLARMEELELDRDALRDDRPERLLLACGIEQHEAAALMRAARARVERAGSVVIEVRLDGHAPRASMRQENLSYLQTRHATRRANLMEVSR
jgi:serine phosphatase RsbU (regulator of sigma subunit)